MHDDVVFIAKLVLLAFPLAVLAIQHFFGRDARVKRQLAKTPRSRLANAVAGLPIKFVGRLERSGEPLSAPMSERNCEYYELVIEEWIRSGRSGRWKTLVQETSGRVLLVRDTGRTALIRAVDAEIAVHKDDHRASGLFAAPTPELESLLARHGQRATGGFGLNRRLRYREGVLEAGEHVAVYGVPVAWSARHAGPDAPADRAIDWIIEPYGETPLCVSDDPAVLLRPKPR